MSSGIVFDIQRFSLQDGPGLRTLVFLKGCPLRCMWCSNPESQNCEPELLYDETRCTRCGSCVLACDHNAISLQPDGRPSHLPSACKLCNACVLVCKNHARTVSGEQMTVEQVITLVKRDMPFFRRSGGGVTLGGGEPTKQPVFAREILQELKNDGLNTAIETCGYAAARSFLSVAEFADLIYYDLKHACNPRHLELTGVGNELIIDNLSALLRVHEAVIVRYPLVPGCNDTAADLHALAAVLLRLPKVPPVELMPYHRFGEHKYRLLQREYALSGTIAPDQRIADFACHVLQQRGLTCRALVH